jgi:lipopolysaccharide/colanic/teichoic acid biosynthesis glycosyltransferase
MNTGHAASNLEVRLDLAVASIGLLVSSPVLLVIALGVRMALGRPVFFRQKRPGRDGLLFTIYKFRTMVEPDFYSGASDEQRLSYFGAWLRRTSLDELPELWNVLRGELSPVGSRPLLMQYVDRYPPGAEPTTRSLAQSHGMAAATWSQRDHVGAALRPRHLECRSSVLLA